jgi:hypothetical protein
MHALADEGKTRAQFQQEALDVIHGRLFHLGLAAGISGADEIEVRPCPTRTAAW